MLVREGTTELVLDVESVTIDEVIDTRECRFLDAHPRFFNAGAAGLEYFHFFAYLQSCFIVIIWHWIDRTTFCCFEF